MLGSRYSAPALVSYVKVLGAAATEVDVVKDVVTLLLLDDVEGVLEDEVEELVDVMEGDEVTEVVEEDMLVLLKDEVVTEVVFTVNAIYPPTARIMMITTTAIMINDLETAR